MTAIDVLSSLGFEDKGTEEFQKISDDLNLGEEFPHKVLYVGTKGGVTALIEKNVSPDTSGGVEVITRHPAVLILESAKGRVAVANQDDPENADLIASVVKDLS